MAKKAKKTYGTFVMNGVRRTAHSPADRVQMVYDGWTEMKTLDAATAAAEAASAAAGGPAPSVAGSGSGNDSGNDSAKVKGPARQQAADSKTTSR